MSNAQRLAPYTFDFKDLAAVSLKVAHFPRASGCLVIIKRATLAHQGRVSSNQVKELTPANLSRTNWEKTNLEPMLLDEDGGIVDLSFYI